MNTNISIFVQRAKPYLYLTLIAIVAYLPVSFFLYSLKNDILTLEYPINYFISQSLHQGVRPYWFNTWALGFPLEGFITWSIYNPFCLFFCGLFHYNIYVLHAEFIFFISFSGWCMYYFLVHTFNTDRKILFVLSICYMLSGFSVASSQWLLYITASGFLPLAVCQMIKLLRAPTLKRAVVFSAIFYCMLTGEYVAFSIVAVYVLIAICVFYLFRDRREKQLVRKRILYLFVAALICCIVCMAPVYSTWQVLGYLNRSAPATSNPEFFNSNALHPLGLISLILPFGSGKMQFFHTEGTMMDLYMGLFPLLVLPYCIWRMKKGYMPILFLAAGLFFLLCSMGPYTPLRGWINILPGFAYFRNAGLLRLFFIFFMTGFIACCLSGSTWKQLTDSIIFKKFFSVCAFILMAFYAVYVVLHISALKNTLSGFSLHGKSFVQSLRLGDCLLISAVLQLVLLILFITGLKKIRLFIWFAAGDVLLNTLICTPFFTVSSYSPSFTSTVLKSVDGFAVQTTHLTDVPTMYSIGNATWFNLNVFQKQVSSRASYLLPLCLKSFDYADTVHIEKFDHRVVYGEGVPEANVRILIQHPDLVVSNIASDTAVTIHFLQNYFPGWSAYFNGKNIDLLSKDAGMSVRVPRGGRVEFRYEKRWMDVVVVLLQLFFWGVGLMGVKRVASGE